MRKNNSLFAEYIKEVAGDGIVETSKGFATFSYIDNNIVYLKDIYVKPKYRKQRIAWMLADKVTEIAVKDGRNIMLGSVNELTKTPERSIKMMEAYGMKFYKSAAPMHFFAKQIAEIPTSQLSEPAQSNSLGELSKEIL